VSNHRSAANKQALPSPQPGRPNKAEWNLYKITNRQMRLRGVLDPTKQVRKVYVGGGVRTVTEIVNCRKHCPS
jgi:hypothetical protein